MRNSFLLALLLISMPSANAIIMTNDGLETGAGSIKWEQLINLPKRLDALDTKVQTLQNALFVATILVAGTVIYLQWSNSKNESISDQNDLVIAENSN